MLVPDQSDTPTGHVKAKPVLDYCAERYAVHKCLNTNPAHNAGYRLMKQENPKRSEARPMKHRIHPLFAMLFVTLMLAASGCVATTRQIIPTQRPTVTPTSTATATPRIIGNVATTAAPTFTRAAPAGGPSPTPLFGAGPAIIDLPVATTPPFLNPTAPRIEYFTTDVNSVSPGSEVRLYWSIINVERAQIYRINAAGQRTQTYNIPPDGTQIVTVGSSERGSIDFQLVAGERSQQVQQSISIPILCPIAWFFIPAPEACPSAEAVPTTITEQTFERGRMLHLAESNRIYVLFNDAASPAWVDFPNLYDPTVHPERDEGFELAIAGTGLVQPVGKLGFVWRGNDTVRNRLGVGTAPETVYEGSTQRAPTSTTENSESVFITSSTGTVIQLLPEGESWQILTPS
jgi:hypothetical protein